MNKSGIITLVIILALLVCVGLITYYVRITPNDDANSEAQRSLNANADSVYTDLEGNQITFKAYEGKVRIVNTWASWTPFSIQELKDLQTVAAENKDTDVVVLAINRKEPKEQAKRFLKSLPELPDIQMVIDVTDAFYNSVGGYAMPETVFYDSRGNVIFHSRGALTLEQIRSHLQEAMNSTQ